MNMQGVTLSGATIRRWAWRVVRIAAAGAVVGGVVYWVRFTPVPVKEHEVEQEEIVAEVMGTGTLEARVEATISPKISGRISEILADEGERVEAGELLVRLDDEELAHQVSIAEANVEAAEAALVRLATDKRRAAAVAEQARKQHERALALYAKMANTQEDVDKATEALAIAEAGLSRAEAAIAEAEKELVAAEKTLEYHRARLDDTQIRSPFGGLIVSRDRDPGDVVVPGSSILKLVSTDERWVRAWVDETQMARLEEGQPARVVFRSEPQRDYPGTAVRLGREADRETREFLVDVEVLELPENWAVGQRAEVYIETARKASATVLPAEFVTWREEVSGTYVREEGRAAWRPLRLGLRGRDVVEVVEGIEPGAVVVTASDPRERLSEGRRITSP